MKFMCTAKFKDSWFALPPEKQAGLMSATFAWADKYRKLGNLKEDLLFANLAGSYSVWEWSSAEESSRAAMEYPAAAYTELELAPVVDSDVFRKIVKEAADAQKSGKR